ncbi:MAG: oxygen-independent coproporphyrinogen III oxidase [Gammaproteobacteria bacterium]|nr:oxygen-independent coproporphyrinogen III oxidase [Gammaproteobacteria bacterium]NIM72629.1 oxygen-independent coproporphyrinogen III oxidase [Gammaproteobacteria bacterium]NIN37686.1 oxygen-independent coproporphyrinogen III oxidase [Gammaproteobacteria bacterium]NIO24390.1 oxygen-independent coproporphyrinogen III oxidase [Gammaproteobacteria bacterium]NIO64993.1 oxygen-independent coproporphyrinogen III oxidase [Gammaproteobacteria bacterium]
MTVTLFPELVRRYDRSGPRYTSYPPATVFDEGFGEADYRAAAAQSNQGASPRPLSLYFHIPFCSTVCYYCACNKIITANRSRAVAYLAALEQEIALQAALFDTRRPVEQLHWGGGTPTFLSGEQMQRLMQTTRRHFRMRDDDEGEYSVEIDPRTVNEHDMALLRELGFNRVSFGVQDFDPRVQKAVNRLQSYEQTLAVMTAARRHAFHSIGIDLIYGLPFQSVESFSVTLDKVVEAGPDRLAVFNYAHLPEIFKTQRQIDASALPSPEEKLRILAFTIERLQEAGYVYIGMDHFARPEDALARALDDGSLQRNFQGFSSHAECDLVAMGITAISNIGDCYAQNVRDIDAYYARIGAGRLAVFRGVRLDEDDRLRRRVIADLICHGRVDKQAVAADFDGYFADELARLEPMRADGLIEDDARSIRVLDPGRLLVRNICMVFDRYLRRASGAQRFSRAI